MVLKSVRTALTFCERSPPHQSRFDIVAQSDEIVRRSGFGGVRASTGQKPDPAHRCGNPTERAVALDALPRSRIKYPQWRGQ